MVKDCSRAVFLMAMTLSEDPRLSYLVVFACKRKLIKSRLTDGLKIVTFYLALNRPENQLARSRR